MRIVIAGAGEMGFHLAKLLTAEEQDIVIIDSNPNVLDYVGQHLDVSTVRGSSTSPRILKEANIGKADLLIAVTSIQETNITTCILGKSLGAKKTIARISNVELLHLRDELNLSNVGIDEIISPASLAAREIKRLLKQSALTDTFEFEKGMLSLVGITVDEGSQLYGKTLTETAYLNPDHNFTTVAILRDNKTIIPYGENKFQKDDHAYFIAQPDGIERVTALAGKESFEIKNVMILGASKVGIHTAKLLSKKYNIKLVEADKEKCLHLVDELPDTMIINGDGRDINLLKEESIDRMDAFVALTENSETNIMASLVAKNQGVRKTIALVENVDYIHLSQSIGIDTLINKKLIAASFIFRYIRKGEVLNIAGIHGVDAEILEFELGEKSRIVEQPLKDLDFPKTAIVGGVIRDGRGIAVRGNFEFKPKDRVVVLSKPECIRKVESFFKQFMYFNYNFKVIFKVIGILLLINGGFMLTCLPFSFYYNEGDHLALISSSLITLGIGALLMILTRNLQTNEMRKKDGYLIVTMGWLSMSFFGSLPYIISGSIPDLTNAFFETLSGFSTTGATVLTDIESVHKGILFWRSLTQWIGGMGIIVLTVAILPLLGIGGMQLFVAEAPGISPDKLQPRIKETAKRLWIIYCGLTVTELMLLWVGGMSFYDAINHSLTTMATGGFSTKNASIAYFQDPFIQYVIIFFMFMAGTNFTMTYFALHGNFRKVLRNEEFRFYLFFCIAASLIVGLIIFNLGHDTFEKSIRDALFQIISVVTTTGYVTHDYTAWTSFLTVLFFLLMFAGGSAGSTAGGVKLVRHILLIKNSLLELKRILHPSAIIPVRFNGKSVSRDITFNVLAFIMIYILIVCFGAIAVSSFGIDFNTSLGAVATTLGNIGPGIGDVGPVDNFAHLPTGVKWILSFMMLLGRLELFTVLILFTPFFWRKV